ncbi:MAG: hypothetical protein JWQ35_1181 [Bacteriovoracaceae bacterium]|nr:hypothetical protein [Bacteriovoracaceae bacterium]
MRGAKSFSFILVIILWAVSASAESEVDCSKFILKLSDSIISRIKRLSEKYENKVWLSFDAEAVPFALDPIFESFDFSNYWKGLPQNEKDEVWLNLFELWPEYENEFSNADNYDAWFPLLVKPMSREVWNKLVPLRRALSVDVEQLPITVRSHLFVQGHEMRGGDRQVISLPKKNSLPYFFQDLVAGIDRFRMEFRVRKEVRGVTRPLLLFGAFSQMLGQNLLNENRLYVKSEFDVGYHLHMGFHGFPDLNRPEFEYRLRTLFHYWLLKIIHSHPEVPVNDLYLWLSWQILHIYKDDLYDREDINHFELRVHFADPLSEFEEAIHWMEMPKQIFQTEIDKAAKEILKRDPEIIRKINTFKAPFSEALKQRKWF